MTDLAPATNSRVLMVVDIDGTIAPILQEHEQVRWLIEGPLQGILDGQYVAWCGAPRSGSRMQSLMSFAVRRNPAAIVWEDDRAPANAQRRTRVITGQPALVVRPDKFTGLTLDHADRIKHFVEGARTLSIPGLSGRAAALGARMDLA